MFYSLTGTLICNGSDFAVIDCSGVGFKCFTTFTTRRALPAIGQKATLYTLLNVREDALDLFGFSSVEEQGAFKMVIGVSGVGPRVALSILSEFTPQQFALCVVAGDSKTLTRASGVGSKLAQRIVLELKDKLTGKSGDAALMATGAGGAAITPASDDTSAGQAIDALTVLGFSRSEAAVAVAKADPGSSVEDIIRTALSQL